MPRVRMHRPIPCIKNIWVEQQRGSESSILMMIVSVPLEESSRALSPSAGV